MKIPTWVLSVFLAGPTIWFYIGGIKSWLSPETEIVGNWHISPGLLQIAYLTVATWCALLLILLNWAWILHLFTAKRRAREATIQSFRELAYELSHVRARIHNHRTSQGRRFPVQSEITSLVIKLEALGIVCPSMSPNWLKNEGLATWLAFLDFLVPLAEIGDLDGARKFAGREFSQSGDGTAETERSAP